MAVESSPLQIDVSQPSSWARRLTITVPAERIDKQRKKVARRLSSGVNLPGFRKGKVPESVIENRYGPAIDQETVEHVVRECFQEALQQQDLQPINQGSVENLDYDRGEDLTFEVEFEVRPEIELERVGGFDIEREQSEVGDDEVDRVLRRLREEHADWQPVEDIAPEDGDRVSVEITPVGGAHAEQSDTAEPEPRPYDFELGRDQAIPDVEEAIKTLKPGETGEFVINVPAADEDDEHPEDDTEETVRIRLREIERGELPELDDAFAAEVGDFDDVASLRARIREDLAREADTESERGVRRELIEHILAANPFDVPDSMVNQYLDQVLRTDDDTDPEQLAEMRGSARPAAERAIKRILVIERLAEREDLRATQDDVDARIELMAEQRDANPGEIWSQLQKSGRMDSIESEITEEKVFAYLKAQSNIE